jgi:hypothetical protein
MNHGKTTFATAEEKCSALKQDFQNKSRVVASFCWVFIAKWRRICKICKVLMRHENPRKNSITTNDLVVPGSPSKDTALWSPVFVDPMTHSLWGSKENVQQRRRKRGGHGEILLTKPHYRNMLICWLPETLYSPAQQELNRKTQISRCANWMW